jgi:cytochrome c peroxidase
MPTKGHDDSARREEENMKRRVFRIMVCMGVAMLFTGPAMLPAQGGLSPTEEVGKSIFFDLNLSFNKNQSCAACHGPAVGWTGPTESINKQGAVYEGSILGRFGNRKPPSAAYATPSPILHFVIEKKEALFVGGNFWDGRATGEKLGNPAADQAQGPFLNPAEQALPDDACVVYRVCLANYPIKLADVYPGTCDIAWPLPAEVESACSTEGGTVPLSPAERTKVNRAYDKIALAIAAYENSSEVNRFTSKYDYYLKGLVKLTNQEQLGLGLFTGKGKCANCHVLDKRGPKGEPPLLTDFTYDNLGVPANPENPVYAYAPGFVDYGLGEFLQSRPDWSAYGPENLGKQKVPTLRNVALKPSPDFVKAYAHNGYFKSLKGIVHFYNTRDVLPGCPGPYTEAVALAAGCWPAPEVAENVNTTELGNLHLTDAQEAAIVSFLETLSDGFQP